MHVESKATGMITNQPQVLTETLAAAAGLQWYAIRTRSNYEKLVTGTLENIGLQTFLPLVRSQQRRAHALVESALPLFPGYVFCRFDARRRVPVLSTPGVVSVVGFGKEPAPIPDAEIEAVQVLIKSGLPLQDSGYLKNGQRVRIRCGALQGVEGILIKKMNEWRFVVSIALLQRSVAVEVNAAWVTVA
jgi:transcriptional antiterminator NusG